MRKTVFYPYLILALSTFMHSCIKDPGDISTVTKTLDNIVVPDNFSYETIKEIGVELTVPKNLSHAVFSIYAKADGEDSLKLGKGTFDEDGYFSSVYTVSSLTDSIIVASEYLGLTDEVRLPIANNHVNFDYSDILTLSSSTNATSIKSASATSVYNYVNSYNSQGVPSVLEFDEISQSLLDDINASLPESKQVPTLHPEYLASDNQTNIVLIEDAEIWVTFVSEGANWKNALGYYTYQKGNAPASADDITDLKIIFPNVSASGSGGGLVSGDKVYLGTFSANTVVAWFLVGNGWNGTEVVENSLGTRYSQSELNEEDDADLQQHMVLLNDDSRSIQILGFEDVARNKSNCDQDFNDAVFYTTVTPASAVDTGDLPSVDTGEDTDGDGVNDDQDDYPNNPDEAFDDYYPSESTYSSLIFEDLWPSKGDYDFNDLVTDYQYHFILNGDNKIIQIDAAFYVKNIGASYSNGLAFVLDIAPSYVKSVEGQVLNSSYLSLSSNGTELGLDNSVIFVAENTRLLEGDTINLSIILSSPVAKSELGTAPYNPFIVVNGERGREVHLADCEPTSKADSDYFDTYNDASVSDEGVYYKSEQNLPWALNIHSSFPVIPEKTPISDVYPRFISWASSGGVDDQDWYED